MKKIDFMKALNFIDLGVGVTCTVDSEDPVTYKVIDEELTVNGKIYDFRDFCFSPSQILFGTWTVESGKEEVE